MSTLVTRLQYYRRIFSAYIGPGASHLTFWHEQPEVNLATHNHVLGEYYMVFAQKANYAGPRDRAGIPMLDYHGQIGLQYNPIAIAQYGLGNYNAFHRSSDADCRENFVRAADWLVANLQPNHAGVPVWNHNFDWEYRNTLRAPWYSGLAQGQGISLLVRAHAATGNRAYLEAACQAFQALQLSTSEGGVLFRDSEGRTWIEEYIVDPPTHILNGFMWAAWGVYDYWLATAERTAWDLFAASLETLLVNLPHYDTGYWSLYEQAGTRLPMLSSPFYHRLHIVQLQVMARLTGESAFDEYVDRWRAYERDRAKRMRALLYKCAFKLCYY